MEQLADSGKRYALDTLAHARRVMPHVATCFGLHVGYDAFATGSLAMGLLAWLLLWFSFSSQ